MKFVLEQVFLDKVKNKMQGERKILQLRIVSSKLND